MDKDLDTVLGRYPAVARPSAEPEALGNAGGLSGSRLWRYRSGLGTLLARAWPHDGPSRSALEEIHGWLGDAGDLGFVPVPLRGLDGRTLYEGAGQLWEVTPWMAGEAVRLAVPSPERVRAAFSSLAAFHQRLARHGSTGPSPGLWSRRGELAAWLGGGFARVEQVLDARRDDEHAGAARRWVEEASVRAPRVLEELTRAAAVEVRRQPCLRDARPEHFLMTGTEVSGLVDFGAMGVDTVATDVARLLAEWPVRDAGLRGVALHAYAALRPMAPQETALLDVFGRSASLLGGGHWVRWHFLEGRAFRDPTAVARGLAKGLERVLGVGDEWPPGRVEPAR